MRWSCLGIHGRRTFRDGRKVRLGVIAFEVLYLVCGVTLTFTSSRATLITWRRPNFGVGSIRDREQLNMQNYTKERTEHTLYTPLQLQTGITDKSDQSTSSFYKQLGESCAKNRVCVDVILHTRPTPMAFLDLATLGELCRTTSGHLKWIRSRHWEEQLLEELR